jgi:hypothetical protein
MLRTVICQDKAAAAVLPRYYVDVWVVGKHTQHAAVRQSPLKHASCHAGMSKRTHLACAAAIIWAEQVQVQDTSKL